MAKNLRQLYLNGIQTITCINEFSQITYAEQDLIPFDFKMIVGTIKTGYSV